MYRKFSIIHTHYFTILKFVKNSKALVINISKKVPEKALMEKQPLQNYTVNKYIYKLQKKRKIIIIINII